MPDCAKHAKAVRAVRCLLLADSADRARRNLNKYLCCYKGRLFDTGIDPDGCQITVRDFTAVEYLNVRVHDEARLRLKSKHDEIETLLCKIPTKVDLAEVACEEFDRLLGASSAAWVLWNLLHCCLSSQPRRSGRGVTSGKLLHAKRPRLIPIFDSRVRRALGASSLTIWEVIWCVMQDKEILAALRNLQAMAPKAQELSLVRVLDIIVWMSSTDSLDCEKVVEALD